MANPRGNNGLSGFSLHRAKRDDGAVMAALGAEIESTAFGVDAVSAADTDPETAARQYLANALQSSATPDFTLPSATSLSPGFKLLGTETVALAGTKSVKFRQVFNKIPVYGSLVTVELDLENRLVGITSSIGEPTDVSPIAQIAPAEALRAIEQDGADVAEAESARILFYFDDVADPPRWRLCYLFEDVPLHKDAANDTPLLPVFNYMVDAHTGEVVSRISRIAGVTEVQAQDELGQTRTIRVSPGDPPNTRLHDPVTNVRTYDHGYADWELEKARLTSRYCEAPPELSRAAVSAHANAAAVVDFLRSVLQRRGVDNGDGPLISTINCLYWRQPAGELEWLNAAWIGTQMVYGQRQSNDGLVSTAADLDIVAHEITHGIIAATAGLQYLRESGALNESYADIFGIIIANRGKPRGAWDYRIGRNFRSDGRPLRDISNPAARNHPAHMDQWFETDNDFGGVHTNSAIHNKAAHNVMVAGGDTAPLFSEAELAALFYIALTQHLSRTSRFADSRRAMIAAALTLFRDREQPEIDRRVAAIAAAFHAVGIA